MRDKQNSIITDITKMLIWNSSTGTVHLKKYTEKLLTILLSRIVVIASDIIYGLGVCHISELFAVCFGRSFVFVYQPSLRRERDAKTGGSLILMYMYFIKQKTPFLVGDRQA
jgi:hypothetical protein